MALTTPQRVAINAEAIFLIKELGSPPALASVIIKPITVPIIPIVGAYPPILVKMKMFEKCLSCIAFISEEARLCNKSESVPSITYLTSFCGNKYSSWYSLFSIASKPSFLDIIEKSTKLLISCLKLYLEGKYAIFINFQILLNLSKPNPIITAEKVPPKTIINGGIKNKAPKEPPSKKKAPKIDNTPNSNPSNAPIFLFISNLVMIELEL